MPNETHKLDRRSILLGTTAAAAAALSPSVGLAQQQQIQTQADIATGKTPNILIIWGDDVGIWNLSCYHRGMMGGSTPNIDRIAREGMMFMDMSAQASCTAGRAAFITGQYPVRTGLTTVGLPGADQGLQKEDPTIAELLKPHGYACGQFGKNHLGDLDKYLPTVHGFDEFFGILYHLNAGEYPELYDYPKNPAFGEKFGTRGVIHSYAQPDGTQKVIDTGPFGSERQKTLDEEIMVESKRFITDAVRANKPFFVWHNTTRTHIHTHLSAKYKDKSGYGLYADAMMELDDSVGELLKLVDELGVTDNTIVMFSTDNGANVYDWPDGGNTPFHGEKGLTWEGGFRVPCVLRWPGKVPAGSVSAEFITMEDWLPTLLGGVGEPDVKEQLLRGKTVNGVTYKVHLDGFDQTDAITGKGPSRRSEFVYFAETDLQAIRYKDWKFHFITQDKWFQGVKTKLNTPLIINLKLDPFERFIYSRGYGEWQEDRAFALGGAALLVRNFAASLRTFPPRQRGVNFDVNEMMQSLSPEKFD